MSKPLIAYHASHEQFSPSLLLKFVKLAEAAGFDAVNSSDHFHPWSERQGQSGYSFSWLGAAMQATSLPFSAVCSPGQRNHPAIVAQAIATLSEMFPGRFTLALGSGEAVNECITGEPWPEKPARNERLEECYYIIRALLQGSTVNHDGHVHVRDAKLYTRPDTLPLLIGAALTPQTAAWMGSWAEGLVTVSAPYAELREVVDAFRNNGGAGKPVFLKVQLSYAQSEGEAIEGAYDQWRTNVVPNKALADVASVAEFDKLGEKVSREDLLKSVNIFPDIQGHIDAIRQYLELDFHTIILHNVNREQELFIKDFGKAVLPAITSR